MKREEKRLVDRIRPEHGEVCKTAFLSCVITGFLVHLFAFTNIIPNCDGLSRVFDEQQMTVSGRWFLHYASMFHGFVQAPMLIGTLSVLFLAVASALTADLLQLRSRVSGALCGAFLVSFPSLAYTYLFVFTASAYAFGILLAVFSVWLCRRFPKWFWIGILPLACSIGTYQAYFAVAASLALCCVIMDLLETDLDLSQAFFRAVRLVAVLAVGAVVYYGMLLLFLWVKDLELLSYRGMDSFLADLTLGGIATALVDTYQQFFRYFLVPGSASYVTMPLILAQLLLFLAGGGALVKQVLGSKLYRQPARLALLILVGLLLPLGLNFSQLLSKVSPVMRYSFVVAWLLPLMLLDQIRGPWHLWLKRTACVAAAAILLFSAQIANTAYTSSATAHRATQAFATNLVSRVESLPGYEQGMEVVVIGGFPEQVYYNGVEGLDLVELRISCLSSSVMPLNKHIYYYLNDWLNVPWEEPEEAVMIAISDSEAFRAMPLYPSDGSVAIIDGRVVVRLAEEYTPKQEFEIAYENRK